MIDWIASSAHHSRGCGHDRRATTLIEVLATLSVLLVIGVAAAGILGSITEIGAGVSRTVEGRAAVQRLANVIRRDVHRAQQLKTTDAWPLEMTTGQTTVQYQWNGQTRCIQRSARRGDDRQAVDRFRLPDHCDPRVSANDEMVTVVLSEPGKSRGRWIIEASHR